MYLLMGTILRQLVTLKICIDCGEFISADCHSKLQEIEEISLHNKNNGGNAKFDTQIIS